MKTLLSILTLLLLMSCGSAEPPIETEESFDFVLEGTIENAEGKVLALIPADGTTDDRLTTTVREGKYRFEGKSKYLQKGTLRFEEDIVNLAGEYSVKMAILEPGITTLNLKVEDYEGRSKFSALGFEQGENNLNLISFIVDYENAIGDGSWVFGDSIRNDSMIRLVYPAARERLFRLFDQQFSSGEHGANAVLLDDVLLSNLNGKGLYNRKLLTIGQKEKIKGYFTNLDSSIINPKVYSAMREVVLHLHEAVPPQLFQELDLYAANDWSGKLSEKVTEHDYAMLYFWFTECQPCRRFNQQMKKDYAALQAKGIEIIAINVDDSKVKWKTTSQKDSIPWTNLYAGDNSGAEKKYSIRGYPKKLAFDRQLDFVNVGLKTMEEVLAWAKEVE